MTHSSTRRQFLAGTSAAAIGFWVSGRGQSAEQRAAPPSERLNLGLIGVGGRGAANTSSVADEPGVEIVALCDVNTENLEQAAAKFPRAKTCADWRQLVEQKDVDAVIISTPDRHHALAAVAAMKRGMHVYCEKPLAYTVHEAYVVRETYRQSKVATQMGTQIHATDNYRRVVELIQAGTIGAVRECHVWCNRVGLPPDTRRPEPEPVPSHINWDLWLGPAPERPFSNSYMGGCMVWEQWWDFGNGCLGDMGSHLNDLPFWALKLRHPTSVEVQGANRSEDYYPQWLTAKWEHPATAERPGLTMFWYDGPKRPPAPEGMDFEKLGKGIYFVGDQGQLWCDYGSYKLLPEKRFEGVEPDNSIPPSLGHHREWLHACRTGAPTLCNFDYSSMLIEHNLLGVAAWRVGKKLTWDPVSRKAVGCPEADRFLHCDYRPGWTI